MPRTTKTTLADLNVKMQGITDLKILKKILNNIDTQQGEKAIMTTKRTKIIKQILEQRTDLKEYIDTLYNRGSQSEVLYYRQVEHKPNHRADKTKGQDNSGRWPSEHKYISNNNATTGYATMNEWVATGTRQNMVLTFEDRAFKIPTSKWADLVDLLDFKFDKSKNTYKIKGIKKNYKIVNKFMKGKYNTLDLTV